MEQNDSLRQEMQNLARIEQEQKEILKELNMNQKAEASNRKLESMKRDMSSGTTYNGGNPYTPRQSVVSYGDQPFYNQTGSQQGYDTSIFNSHSQSFMMNPFGQQARDASSYYNDIQRNATGKNLSILDVVAPSSSTSLKNRDLMGMEYGNRFGTAAITATGAGASFLTNWKLAGAMPGLAGMGMAIGGGALVGAYAGLAVDESKQNNALAKYIYKTSGMYIDMNESTNQRMISGFSRQDSRKAASYVRKMNDDFFMKDDDISMLLQEFTEGGMLRDVSNLQGFKDRMASLTKTVKEGAVLLDETYDSIAQLMSDMKKLGIDEKSYKSMMGMGNIIGGLTGQSGSEMVRQWQDYLKNSLSGTDYDADNALQTLENTAIYVSNYYDQLEKNQNRNIIEESNYNYIKNLGGANNASMQMHNIIGKIIQSDEFENPALMFFDYDKSQKDFVFNQKKYDEFMRGGYSLQEVYNDGSQKFTQLQLDGHSEAIDRWKNNAHMYVQGSLNGDMQMELLQKTLSMYAADPSFKAQGLDERTALSLFGVTDSGTQNFLSGMMGFRADNTGLIGKTNIMNMWQMQAATAAAETPSLTEWISSLGEKLTDAISDPAVGLNNAIGEGIQKMVDNITGYDRRLSPRYDQTFVTRADNIESVSYDEVTRRQKEIGQEMAYTKKQLEDLEKAGYAINSDLNSYVDKKFGIHSDGTVNYSRDIISDWNSVDSSLRSQKDLIQSLAGGKDLSEVIVASLLKYNQQKPKDGQINLDEFTSKLEANMSAYGGNQDLAVYASMDDANKKAIDDKLNQLGYDMEALRKAGMQEVVLKVTMDDVGISVDGQQGVRDLTGQNIGARGGQSAINGQDINSIDFANMSLSSRSGLSIEQIQAVIDKNTANKPDSILKQDGVAEAFYNAERDYGVNAAFMLGLAGLEGTWGASDISKAKNNPFGWGANDSNPMGLAKQWSSAADGINSFASAVASGYIYSDNHGQNTLQKMKNGSTYDPGHQYNSRQSWVDDNALMMKNVYLTAAEAGDFETSSSRGVATTSREVFRGADGAKLNADQQAKAIAERGFGMDTEYTANMGDFLQYADKITSPTKFIDYAGNRDAMKARVSQDFEAMKKQQMFGTYKSLGAIEISSPGMERNKLMFENTMTDLIGDYVKLYDPTKSMDEIFSTNDIIQDKYNKVLSYFDPRYKQSGEDYIRSAIGQLTMEKELSSKNNSYEVLQAWGREFMGLTIEDTNYDVTAYNDMLLSEATEWYRQNLENYNAFLTNKSSDAAKQWAALSADEKTGTLKSMKHMQDVLGANDKTIVKLDTVNRSNNARREDAYTEQDVQLLQYLHKDVNGEWYYDATKGGGNATWSDYDAWNASGRRSSKVGSVEEQIKKSVGADIGNGLTTTQLISSIYKQKDAMLNTNYQSQLKAKDISRDIAAGRVKLSGFTDDEAFQVASMLSGNDTAGLQSIMKAKADSGQKFDSGILEQYIKLTETINSTDISVISSLVSGVQEIVDIGKDAGNTAMFMNYAMGKGFTDTSSKKIMENVNAVFDTNSDVADVLNGKKGEDAVKVLTDLLINGGVDYTTGVQISADSLEALTAAVSEGVTSSVKDSLANKEGIQELVGTELYKEAISSGATVSMDDMTQSLESAVARILELTGEIEGMTGTEQNYKDLVDEKSELVDAVTETYLQSIEDLSDKMKDGDKNLTESEKIARETARIFESTFQKYDAAIKTSIDTMNNTIFEFTGKRVSSGAAKSSDPVQKPYYQNDNGATEKDGLFRLW